MQKNYKESILYKNMNLNKKGQMTIFIIVAVVIVLALLFLFLFRKNIPSLFESGLNPNEYLKQCVEPEVKPSVEILADNAGYQEPQAFVLSEGKKIQYLCYTNNYYETCTVQQPLTKKNFEKELNLMVKPRANRCMKNLIAEYEKRGYEVSSEKIDSEVSVIPGKVLIRFNTPLIVTKEITNKYSGFNVEMESEIYDLLFIAQSIVEYESTYGDSASELYLQYYPNLKIEKTKMSDGTTIYKLSNVITKEEFKFASRSLAWPAGYGTDQIKEAK